MPLTCSYCCLPGTTDEGSAGIVLRRSQSRGEDFLWRIWGYKPYRCPICLRRSYHRPQTVRDNVAEAPAPQLAPTASD